MAERKALSKKTRFEVFKRDGFTCQYCGRSSPDVILEVDHINPVKHGGKNELLNLITSCVDCNRGKGARKLSDNEMLNKQKQQLKELSEKREQLKMMLDWKNELEKFEDEQVGIVVDKFSKLTDVGITDTGRKNVAKWIREFGISEVLECVQISYNQYYYDRDDCQKVFSYIPRIANTRKRQAEDPTLKMKSHIKSILNNRLRYVNYGELKDMLIGLDADDLELVREVARDCKNWSDFSEQFYELFYGGE